MNLSKIIIYDEPAVPELQLDKLVLFIKNNFSVEVEKKNSVFSNSTNIPVEKIASTRVHDLKNPFKVHQATIEEIEFEKMIIQDSLKNKNLVFYDGFEFQNVLRDFMDEKITTDILHIIFTNRLMCSFDPSDFRYHGRAIICGNPTIISTSGIIEAPAKPREYYFDLISNMMQGLNLDSIKKKYEGKFLEPNDERLKQVAEGYVLQGIFYHITELPFCENKDCRLFNPHWQKDLIYSQIQVGKLCDIHQKILEKFGD